MNWIYFMKHRGSTSKFSVSVLQITKFYDSLSFKAFLWFLAAGICPEYHFFRCILQFIQ